MKKTIIVYIFLFVIIILASIVIINLQSGKNDFNYESAKEITKKFLNENEDKLKNVVNSLYESKKSKNDVIKGVSYASYNYLEDFNFNSKIEYIKFDIDSQGMLGGQYYA